MTDPKAMTDLDPKARERAQQWYNRWAQENFFGSSRNTVDSLAQLLLQVQAEGRLAALEEAAQVADKLSDPHAVAQVIPSCESPLSVAVIATEIAKAIRARQQASAEGGK